MKKLVLFILMAFATISYSCSDDSEIKLYDEQSLKKEELKEDDI